MSFFNKCRLCAKSKSYYIHIFHEEGQKLGLGHKIVQYLQIQISRDDGLPTVVCSECCKKLSDISRFHEQSLNAQVVLQAICQEEVCSSAVQRKSSEEKEVLSINKMNDVHATYSVKGDNIVLKMCTKNTVKSAPKMLTQLANSYSWHCTDCPATLENRQKLQDHHLNIHQQPVKFLCLHCSKIFTVYKKYSRHVRLHRNHGKFRCGVCLRGFSTRQAVSAHEVLHSEAQTFTCKECGCSFRHASTLYYHQHLHASDVYPCSQCKMILTSQRALQQHQQVHSKAQDFMCEKCGKLFSRKQALVRHAATHVEGRTIACSICGKMFRTRQHLQSHVRVHSEERRHQCDVCGKQFNHLSSLTVHSRIHTGEMPYTCEFCGQHFRFRGVYVIHRRKHTGERPYVCAICGLTFTNYANHAKHLKGQHRHRKEEKTSPSQVDIPLTSQILDPFCSSINKDILTVKYSVPQSPRTSSTFAANHFATIDFSPLVPLVNQSNEIDLC